MTITLTGLTIWNGHGRVDADRLTIGGGRIAAIGGPVTGAALDCAGLTAIPGLIDAHVHLELNPDDNNAPTRTLASVAPLMAERAAKMVAAGITTARDLGGGGWHEVALRDAIARNEKIGPRLLCSGQPITSPGGHCHFWGGAAATLAEAEAVLRRQLAHDVDLIKIMATGGRLTQGSDPALAQFSQETMASLVDMAHAAERPVAAHCHGTEGIRRAACAGVDTIEHCSWVGPEGWGADFQVEVADLVLAHGCRVSPTVNKGWQRMLDSSKGEALARVRHSMGQLRGRGVPMIASTDAGIPGVYHEDLPHALLVFARIAQMDEETTLQSATSGAARALGIGAVTGSLEIGKDADVLVVDGDPTKDLGALTRPVHVFARGRAVLGPRG